MSCACHGTGLPNTTRTIIACMQSWHYTKKSPLFKSCYINMSFALLILQQSVFTLGCENFQVCVRVYLKLCSFRHFCTQVWLSWQCWSTYNSGRCPQIPTHETKPAGRGQQHLSHVIRFTICVITFTTAKFSYLCKKLVMELWPLHPWLAWWLIVYNYWQR